MRFDPPLVKGRFQKRYKRFFADVELTDGQGTKQIVVAHCPNTGSLKGCKVEGASAYVQPVDNPNRKLKYSWKLIEVGTSLVGVDTGIANGLVADAIAEGVIPELTGFDRMVTEVKYGREGKSRIDLLLSRGGDPPKRGKPERAMWSGDERVYVEVKNTTLASDCEDGRRAAAFPDAVTERGRKHLHELMGVVADGQRAAMVFCVQRMDCDHFTPAAEIDPAYASSLREAVDAGVEIYVLAADLTPEGVTLTTLLPVELP